MKFGDLIKIELVKQHLTQKELAARLDMSVKGVNSLVNRDNISLDKMQALAAALGCDLLIELRPIQKP